MKGPKTSAWALVTGASGGIGREMALQLAQAGWRLVLVARNATRLEACKAALKGPRAAESVVITADLSRSGAALELNAELERRGIELEILVNNAGTGVCGQAETLDTTQVESMITLNITSLSALCTLIGAGMVRRGYGRILNVGSFAGLNPAPYFAAYNATKSFVLPFSLALRAEYAPKGVLVSCVLPGFVQTEFDDNAGINSEKYRKFSHANSLDAATVARIGLRCLDRNRAWEIAGFANKVSARVMGLLPRSLAPVIMKKVLDPMLEWSK